VSVPGEGIAVVLSPDLPLMVVERGVERRKDGIAWRGFQRNTSCSPSRTTAATRSPPAAV